MSIDVQPLDVADGLAGVVGLYEHDADRYRAEKAWAWRRRDEAWVVGASQDGALQGFLAARPTRLLVHGREYASAQVGGGGLGFSTKDPETDARMLAALLDRLREEGIELAFTAAADPQVELFQTAGFRWLFEVFGRNMYVGLEKVSTRLSRAALNPVRRLAKEARRLRPKLLDRDLDEACVRELAELIALEAARPEFAVVKDEAYLRWRYLEDPRAKYRALTYRSKAGQGVAGFAIVRHFEPEAGRAILHVEELWTRRGSRRDLAKLLSEIALVALSESCDAVRCTAAGGSAAEQALISLSCIRKKVDRNLMACSLVDGVDLPDPFATQGVQIVSGDLSLYAT